MEDRWFDFLLDCIIQLELRLTTTAQHMKEVHTM